MRKVCLWGVVCLAIGFAMSVEAQGRYQIDPGLLDELLFTGDAAR